MLIDFFSALHRREPSRLLPLFAMFKEKLKKKFNKANNVESKVKTLNRSELRWKCDVSDEEPPCINN